MSQPPPALHGIPQKHVLATPPRLGVLPPESSNLRESRTILEVAGITLDLVAAPAYHCNSEPQSTASFIGCRDRSMQEIGAHTRRSQQSRHGYRTALPPVQDRQCEAGHCVVCVLGKKLSDIVRRSPAARRKSKTAEMCCNLTARCAASSQIGPLGSTKKPANTTRRDAV